MTSADTRVPEPVVWAHGTLRILDQRLLPDTVAYEDQADVRSVAAAIRDLKVRGAPAIGIAAAYGLVLAAQQGEDLEAAAATLKAARPTAVNLAWAVDRVRAVAADPDAALNEAQSIHAEDRAICRAIGSAGRHLLRDGATVMTHCNAGALAVSELGTATAPMYLAHDAGVEFRVIANETRPVLQGARLTVWELDRAGIDVTLACDSAAGRLMAEGAVDLIIVGADRVTANGDVVNKIGTATLAILARHFGIPFYVACPSSTFDPDTPCGADVEIEERSGDEVRQWPGLEVAAHIPARNPAFDVTPHELVSAFITDRGLLEPPFQQTLTALRRTP
jgi:methylthioribose-1-phosphate isomerase